MIKADYFKHCKKKIMKIHTLVSLTLFKYRQNRSAWCHLQNADERWLDKERAKEVLSILDALDFCLDHGKVDDYLEQLKMLWPLLNESKIGTIIYDKIALEFGEDCFFLQYD
jgi:hypothetical protein